MTRALLLMTLTIVSVPARNVDPTKLYNHQKQSIQPVERLQEPPVKFTIGTVGDSFTNPTDTFKVGDQILVTVTMTNISPKPVDACVSADLYQTIPSLTK